MDVYPYELCTSSSVGSAGLIYTSRNTKKLASPQLRQLKIFNLTLGVTRTSHAHMRKKSHALTQTVYYKATSEHVEQMAARKADKKKETEIPRIN